MKEREKQRHRKTAKIELSHWSNGVAGQVQQVQPHAWVDLIKVMHDGRKRPRVCMADGQDLGYVSWVDKTELCMMGRQQQGYTWQVDKTKIMYHGWTRSSYAWWVDNTKVIHGGWTRPGSCIVDGQDLGYAWPRLCVMSGQDLCYTWQRTRPRLCMVGGEDQAYAWWVDKT